MISYEEAKRKAMRLKEINCAGEFNDMYMFSYDDGSGDILDGPQPVVVLKETGECMWMLEYRVRFLSIPIDELDDDEYYDENSDEEIEDDDNGTEDYYFDLDFETGERIRSGK